VSTNQNAGTLDFFYNICFQTMTHNATGSAYTLGQNCTYLPGSRLTKCASNMAQMIEGTY